MTGLLTSQLKCLKPIADAMRLIMYDLDTPRFTSSQVAGAAGMSINTFRTNFMRGHFEFIGGSFKPAGRQGMPHHFGLRDAIGFAIAGELIKRGLSPRDAWETALLGFAHSGTEDRDPGELFNYDTHGSTVLLYWPTTKTSAILPMKVKGGGPSFTDLFYPTGYNFTNGVIVLLLDPIYKTIIATLDDNPLSIEAGRRLADG